MEYGQAPQSRLKTVLKMSWAILGIIVISAFILFFALIVVGFLIVVIGGPIVGTLVPEWLQWTACVLWVVVAFIVSGVIVFMSPFIELFFAMMDWACGRTPVMVFE